MILYEDPYKVLLLIRSTANQKTGPIPSLWGFVPHIAPRDAVNTGLDAAICLNCVHKKQNYEAADTTRCYTHKGQTLSALAGIVKKHSRGGYVVARDHTDIVDFLRGERVQGATAIRSMAYGDMAAFPASVWAEINEARKSAGLGVRGYTQQWNSATHLKSTHMASVTNALQAATAESLGWRTFWSVRGRVAPEGRVQCPASKELKLTTCNQCTLCDGSRKAPGVWIYEH